LVRNVVAAGAILGVLGAGVLAGFLGGRKPAPDAAGGAAGQPAPPAPAWAGGSPVAFAAEAEPTKMARPAEAVPAGVADTVFLLPDDTPGLDHVAPDLFERELARQALWLAGREEFGLRVRDSALGDPAPEGLPEARQFRIRYVPLTAAPWSVVAGAPGSEHTFWRGNLVGFQYSVYPARCLAGHEQLSRGFFAKCLAGAGLARKPNRRSEAPVPPEAEAALGEMRESAQFAALRRLHEEVRAKGESDALVAALARGYANLGLLTEFHWGPAPFAFKARGALYAQRLVARSPNSPAALRTRAYAAVLAGLHALALEDLAAAAKLPADPKAPAQPWVEAIDSYAHFDLARLASARKEGDSPLVRLLQFLAAEAPEAHAATIRAGRELLAADPECYRAHDSMCRVGGVAHLHEATAAGAGAFARSLAGRVGEMPGLPGAVRDSLGEDPVEPKVYAALRAAGAADRGEPSWAALGGLLQEVRFTQAWHRLYFMAQTWGVETEEAAAAFSPLLAGHRLRPLIDSFSLDPRRKPGEFRRLLLAAPVQDVDMKASGYYFRLLKVDPEAARKWYQRANHGHGSLYPEMARKARGFPDGYAAELGPLSKFLVSGSPHAPLGQALTAVYGGPEVVARLGEIEAKGAGHAVVQWGVGRRHLADGRTADALRCWKRWAELSPSGDAFRKLAGAYLKAGDEAGWRRTLEASLKEEDTGLFHAQVRVEIARHYMRKKDFARAEPYAAAAAASYAEWALLCAAECQEGLGHWGEANALYEAATDRYGQSCYAWYFECRASGKMDRAAAERAVRGHLARFGPGATAGELFRAARFHLLAGDDKEARALTDRANAKGGSDLTLLFGALLADAAGDAKGRAATLDAGAKLPAEKNKAPAIGAALREWSASASAPHAAAVVAALAKVPPESRPDAEFYFGWFLENRKLRDRADALWKRCAQAEAGTGLVKTHARACLDRAARKRD
jgi:hypothetical protein